MSEIQTVNQEGIVIVNLKGRVDATNSEQLHDTIMREIEDGCNKMIINFSEVYYISSAGLRVLILTIKRFAENTGSFAVCSLAENIMRTFEISGLANQLIIHDDVETGVRRQSYMDNCPLD